MTALLYSMFCFIIVGHFNFRSVVCQGRMSALLCLLMKLQYGHLLLKAIHLIEWVSLAFGS